MNPKRETYLALWEPTSGHAVLTWNGGAIRGKHEVGLWGLNDSLPAKAVASHSQNE